MHVVILSSYHPKMRSCTLICRAGGVQGGVWGGDRWCGGLAVFRRCSDVPAEILADVFVGSMMPVLKMKFHTPAACSSGDVPEFMLVLLIRRVCAAAVFVIDDEMIQRCSVMRMTNAGPPGDRMLHPIVLELLHCSCLKVKLKIDGVVYFCRGVFRPVVACFVDNVVVLCYLTPVTNHSPTCSYTATKPFAAHGILCHCPTPTVHPWCTLDSPALPTHIVHFCPATMPNLPGHEPSIVTIYMCNPTEPNLLHQPMRFMCPLPVTYIPVSPLVTCHRIGLVTCLFPHLSHHLHHHSCAPEPLEPCCSPMYPAIVHCPHVTQYHPQEPVAMSPPISSFGGLSFPATFPATATFPILVPFVIPNSKSAPASLVSRATTLYTIHQSPHIPPIRDQRPKGVRCIVATLLPPLVPPEINTTTRGDR